MTQNKSPTQIKTNENVVNKPKAMADAFNEVFLDKVEKIRRKTNQNPKIDPALRLRTWLSKRAEPLQEFSLKEISGVTLRKL